MLSMSFFGGLAEGGLEARRQKAVADNTKAKNKQEEAKRIADMKKAIAQTGMMNQKEMSELANITDLSVLTAIFADKTKLKGDNQRAADLSVARTNFEGIGFLHSNGTQNVFVPNVASIGKNRLGMDGKSFTDALKTAQGATQLADATFNTLDNALASDPDMPLDKFRNIINTRFTDLLNISQKMPQHAIGARQGLQYYFPSIYKAYKGKVDHLKALEESLVEHKFFKQSSKGDDASISIDQSQRNDSGENAVVAITKVPSLANIDSKKVDVVEDVFDPKIGPHEKAILSRATMDVNKPFNRDTQGAIPEFGLKTIVNNLDSAVSQGSSVDNKYNAFANSYVNPTDYAKEFLDSSSAFELLDDRLTEKFREYRETVYRNRRTGLATKERVEILPSTTAKEREEKFAQALIRQSSALNGAASTVKDIELIAQNVGIMIRLEEAGPNATLQTIFKDSDAEEIKQIYGILSQYINDNNSSVVVDAAGNPVRVMSKNNFHNALLTSIANQDRLVSRRLREVGVDTGLVMSETATGAGTFIDNFATGLKGLINQFDTYVGRTRELYAVNSPAAFNNARNTLKAYGADFDKLVEGERQKMAANMDAYNSTTDSRQKLLAYSRAQISFYKINLAYQYAAISQGGEGSARTISDTDFAKNFLALFQESGAGFLGVVDIIKRQTRIQLSANRILMSKATEGRFSKYYPEINALGKSLNYHHSIREKRRPIRSVTTLGGNLGIGRRDTGEDAAAQDAQDTVITRKDMNIYFNDLTTGAKATPLISEERDKSFKLDFKSINQQEAFYSTFQLAYAKALKKVISKELNAKNFGSMKKENAQEFINNNKEMLVYYLFNNDGALGEISSNMNPFNHVTIQDIKGFKSKFARKPISFIINDWNKMDNVGGDKFYYLQKGILDKKFPMEVERLKGEEFVLEKLTDIIMNYMYKNWQSLK